MTTQNAPAGEAHKLPRAKSGTYALVLKNNLNAPLKVGRRLKMQLRPGFYIYIGSAFGPGGAPARLRRHYRENKAKHWHIDYLRGVTEPFCAWVCYEPQRLEHQWAARLAESAELKAIPRFGCSDCRCLSHLFWTSSAACASIFWRSLSGRITKWPRP